MESQKRSNRNLPGVIIAYFLIYVVWGSTYFFIGVAFKRFFAFPARSTAVYGCRADTSWDLLFAGRTYI